MNQTLNPAFSRDERPELRDFVGSLARGLSVIRAFDKDHAEMTLTEVAGRTNLTRAGARRFLLTLTELGYVKKDHRQFSLTPKILELGYSFLASAPIAQRAKPVVDRVAEETGESCNLGVLDGDDMVNVAHGASKHIVMINLYVGARFPACYTAVGRAILANRPDAEIDAYLARVSIKPFNEFSLKSKDALRQELQRVRAQGYAFVDRELHEGMRTLAVPVLDAQGKAAAAINISNHTVTIPREEIIKLYLETLRRAAAEIKNLLAV